MMWYGQSKLFYAPGGSLDVKRQRLLCVVVQQQEEGEEQGWRRRELLNV